MNVNGIVLAAGMSKRMGEWKPQLPIGERTIVESSINSMFQSGVAEVVVVAGYRGEEFSKLLNRNYKREMQEGKLKIAYNKDFEHSDMLASIKIGLLKMGECDAFYLLPGDMPAIKKSTYKMVRAEMERKNPWVVFPTMDGYRKHPPLISHECIPAIQEYCGDGGIREVFNKLKDKILEVKVEDQGCLMDADTREDYLKLKTYMEKPYMEKHIEE